MLPGIFGRRRKVRHTDRSVARCVGNGQFGYRKGGFLKNTTYEKKKTLHEGENMDIDKKNTPQIEVPQASAASNVRLKLYYVAKKEKPCAICGEPTIKRARFFGKRVGYPVCSSLCRCRFNPFV